MPPTLLPACCRLDGLEWTVWNHSKSLRRCEYPLVVVGCGKLCCNATPPAVCQMRYTPVGYVGVAMRPQFGCPAFDYIGLAVSFSGGNDG